MEGPQEATSPFESTVLSESNSHSSPLCVRLSDHVPLVCTTAPTAVEVYRGFRQHNGQTTQRTVYFQARLISGNQKVSDRVTDGLDMSKRGKRGWESSRCCPLTAWVAMDTVPQPRPSRKKMRKVSDRCRKTPQTRYLLFLLSSDNQSSEAEHGLTDRKPESGRRGAVVRHYGHYQSSSDYGL